MIFLTAAFDPARSKDSYRSVAFNEGLSSETLEELTDSLEILMTSKPTQSPRFSLEFAVDQDGNEYRDVTVYFTAKFTRDGDRYVAGEGIAINVDASLRFLAEILELLG